MLSCRHPRREAGFTLIEILVVMLVLALLAAIALPQFLGQKESAMDAQAKSLARNLQTHVESCFTETRDYANCNDGADLPKTQLQWGTDPGEVQVLIRPFGQNVVAFAATSETRTLFAVVQNLTTRRVDRVCFVPSNAYPTGACERGGAFAAQGFGGW